MHFWFQLVFEITVGIAVLVRCFVDRKATEGAIADRLGDGFSRPPFATVVVYYYNLLYFIFVYVICFIYFAKIQLSSCLLPFQALCIAVSLLATVPLAELFFFHIILIRKVGREI